MSLFSKLSILVLTLTLAACASGGTKIDQSQIQTLKKGTTTYDQVVTQFGKPNSNTLNSDGTRKIAYTYYSTHLQPAGMIPIVGAFYAGSDSESSSLTLDFDKNGVLKNYASTEGGSKAH